MLKKLLKVFIKVVVVIFILILIYLARFFTSGDYRVLISNEYRISRIYSRAVLLANNEGVVVGPNIDGYLIFNDYIFGHVSHERLPKEDKEYSTPGYFIVNLTDNSVLQGLDETQYTAELIKRKIQTNKKLHKPSRLDEYFKGGVVKNTSVK